MTDDEFYEATKYTFLGPDPYIPEVPRLSIGEPPASGSLSDKARVPAKKPSSRARGRGVHILLSSILAVELIRLLIECIR